MIDVVPSRRAGGGLARLVSAIVVAFGKETLLEECLAQARPRARARRRRDGARRRRERRAVAVPARARGAPLAVAGRATDARVRRRRRAPGSRRRAASGSRSSTTTALVEPDALAELLAAGERDAGDVGSVAAQVLFADRPGHDQLGRARGRRARRRARAAAREPRGRGRHRAGRGLRRRAPPSASTGGRCSTRVGGLDASFFAYLEDADLAWRARMAGWRCLLAPRAVGLHQHSSTLGHGSSAQALPRRPQPRAHARQERDRRGSCAAGSRRIVALRPALRRATRPSTSTDARAARPAGSAASPSGARYRAAGAAGRRERRSPLPPVAGRLGRALRREPRLPPGRSARAMTLRRRSDHPIVFEQPRRLTDVDSWHEHIPFAFFAVAVAAARGVLVELGTWKGDSYCAFCQAVQALELADALLRRRHLGGRRAHRARTAPRCSRSCEPTTTRSTARSRRSLQQTFDEAAPGVRRRLDRPAPHRRLSHGYEAVAHDVETWLPKLSDRGRRSCSTTRTSARADSASGGCGTSSSARYRGFAFTHGHGLGVLAVGSEVDARVRRVPGARATRTARVAFFAALGSRIAALGATRRDRGRGRRELAATQARGGEPRRRARELDGPRTPRGEQRARPSRTAARRSRAAPGRARRGARREANGCGSSATGSSCRSASARPTSSGVIDSLSWRLTAPLRTREARAPRGARRAAAAGRRMAATARRDARDRASLAGRAGPPPAELTLPAARLGRHARLRHRPAVARPRRRVGPRARPTRTGSSASPTTARRARATLDVPRARSPATRRSTIVLAEANRGHRRGDEPRARGGRRASSSRSSTTTTSSTRTRCSSASGC